MKVVSRFIGGLAFLVLAVCAIAVVLSCTYWMVQSILHSIW